MSLVIARMIDSVRNSPADLRQAIYDLARYKLQEQFTCADTNHMKRTQQALENAIRGVEEFSNQHVNIPPPTTPPQVTDPASHNPVPPFLFRRFERARIWRSVQNRHPAPRRQHNFLGRIYGERSL